MDSKHFIGLYEAYLDVYEDQKELIEAPYQIYGPDPHGPSDSPSKPLGKPYQNKKRAKNRADKLDQEVGGYRHSVRYVPEELDIYDLVLDHLLDEGYCDDLESAEVIIANMSEEWLDGILDEAKVDDTLDQWSKLDIRDKRHLSRLTPKQKANLDYYVRAGETSVGESRKQYHRLRRGRKKPTASSIGGSGHSGKYYKAALEKKQTNQTPQETKEQRRKAMRDRMSMAADRRGLK